MSKWMKTKVQTLSGIEADFFMSALDRMGYAPDFTTKTVTRSYEGDTQDVACVIREKETGKSTNIGLRFTDNEDGSSSMTVVCDWYYSDLSDKDFISKFTIEYNTVKYESVAAGMNFNLESEETLEDGRRKIVMARVA